MRNPSSTPSTTSTPCCAKVGIKRGPWTPEEDEVLSNYIKKDGEGRWRTLPKRAGLQRCGKSCRLRWMNYLRPCVKRGHIAPDEEDLILRLHRLLGNRWSLIAGRIPGRTDNEIKNYWNTHLSKKLIGQGIDPRTHKPLNPSPPNNTSPLNDNPPSNPNPNNSETSSSHQAANKGNIGNIISNPDPDSNQRQYNQNTHYAMASDDRDHGMMMMSYGGEDRYSNMCNEDTFSSFLDSLINESAALATHQQPPLAVAPLLPQLPGVSSTARSFDHGSIWEAELMRSTMDTLADLQNGFNNHQP